MVSGFFMQIAQDLNLVSCRGAIHNPLIYATSFLTQNLSSVAWPENKTKNSTSFGNAWVYTQYLFLWGYYGDKSCFHNEALRRKVEVARQSVRTGLGRTNEEVEATFAARRNQVIAGKGRS
ncbi:hypothetical protein [Brenneria izbisi]|uniref:Uncharacterized protein n=1 Tax=Brenneria izbisi TaxID=2939450 RepID=A0AA42C5W1_9GAMM|nr:hypothetical protein [Brenneria izbisi]MCV9879654.1 hypothetical protein [Brenneria izbisi]MCV9883152.1 hypothetical protein [Brenneria izbisi]